MLLQQGIFTTTMQEKLKEKSSKGNKLSYLQVVPISNVKGVMTKLKNTSDGASYSKFSFW